MIAELSQQPERPLGLGRKWHLAILPSFPQLQVRIALGQGSKNHLRLHPRQRGPQAEVDSSTEREMLVVVASDMEPIRIHEASWIAFGRRDGNEDRFSC